jgi:3-dehydroquinate dehydratase-2
MKIIIINGPNLNLLGKRETDIYGTQSFESYYKELKVLFPGLDLVYYQSNVEGEIINKLHETGFSSAGNSSDGNSVNGIILNAGGYTHTSVAISDAVAGIKTPVIEVHISNIYAREEYRHVSLISKYCIGVIAGFGLDSYRLAIDAILHSFNEIKPSAQS